MPVKTHHYFVSMAELEAMTSPSFTPFHCAHHWVTDQSIRAAMLVGAFDDPAIPWTAKTHRANRIASIATMMVNGVRFQPLYVHFTSFCGTFHGVDGTGSRIAAKVAYHRLELADGHHRLRALQFLGRTGTVALNVTGNIKALDSLIREHRLGVQRKRFRDIMGPLWQQHEEMLKAGYKLVAQVHDEWVYEAPAMLPSALAELGKALTVPMTLEPSHGPVWGKL